MIENVRSSDVGQGNGLIDDAEAGGGRRWMSVASLERVLAREG